MEARVRRSYTGVYGDMRGLGFRGCRYPLG